MECKSPPKILQLMQYVSRYPFVLKYQDFGPPETSSGTALFVICMIRIMPSSTLLSLQAAWHRARLHGPGTHRLALSGASHS